MMNNIRNFLYSDAGNLSTGQIFAGMFFAAIIIVLFIFLFIFCIKFEKYSGVKSFLAVKTIMVALFPTIYGLINLSENRVSFTGFGVITVIMCIIVLLWNAFSYGLIYGLAFSFIHIVSGLVMSVGIVVLIFGIIATVFLSFFTEGGGPGKLSNQGKPDGVRDLATNEIYDVTVGGNGCLYLNSGGRDSVLYCGDYRDRYFDGNGNQYIAFYD